MCPASPIAAVAWGCEFLLEVSGAYLAYRKRLNTLSLLLVWRAQMDALTFAFLKMHLYQGYGYGMWAGRAVQYALLYALGVQLAAKMTQDFRPITRRRYMTLAIAASVVSYVFVTTDLWEQKFFTAEALAGFLLIAVVGLGWIGRKKELEEPWKLITLGLTLSAAGNASCAILSAYWPTTGLSFYPIPAILALLVWNLAVWPRKKKQALRLELPARMPVESVGLSAEDEDFLKGMRIQA